MRDFLFLWGNYFAMHKVFSDIFLLQQNNSYAINLINTFKVNVKVNIK